MTAAARLDDAVAALRAGRMLNADAAALVTMKQGKPANWPDKPLSQAEAGDLLNVSERTLATRSTVRLPTLSIVAACCCDISPFGERSVRAP